ncbi:MAG TPA: ribonuclease III [Ktedonobacterales bacterium]|nr:ribonuclease III [Ktedonobacterales bacterium]
MAKRERETQIPDMTALQAAIGHSFRHPQVLLDALTHTSYVAEHPGPGVVSNERLEFLGDAVLGLIASDLLYRQYPSASEGELTPLRAALVSLPPLAALARRVGLGPYLRLGRGEEVSGGRERESVLGRAMEALIGALYLDGGIKAARRFLEPLLMAELERVAAGPGTRDAKSLLQERAQARLGITPTYHVLLTEGPSNAPRFVVEARLGELVVGRGEGGSKRQAEQAAARAALDDEGWAAPGE